MRIFTLTSYNFCISTPILELEKLKECDLQFETLWGHVQSNPTVKNVCGVGCAHNNATYLNIEVPIPSTTLTFQHIGDLICTCFYWVLLTRVEPHWTNLGVVLNLLREAKQCHIEKVIGNSMGLSQVGIGSFLDCSWSNLYWNQQIPNCRVARNMAEFNNGSCYVLYIYNI